jgi:hypothetical protein
MRSVSDGGAALLRDLRDLFRERGVDRLATGEIVAAAGERLGRSITANRLARTLGAYGVAPRQFRMPAGSGRRVWGYRLDDLAESRDAPLSGESRDAGAAEPLVPAAPEPRVGIAVQDHLDAEREWSWRVAMAAAAHGW